MKITELYENEYAFLDEFILPDTTTLNENLLVQLFKNSNKLIFAKGIAQEISNAAKAIKLQIGRDNNDNSKNPINDNAIREYTLELKKLNEVYNDIKFPNLKSAFFVMCKKAGYKLPVGGISISRNKPPEYSRQLILKLIMFVTSIVTRINGMTATDALQQLILKLISTISGIGIILELIFNSTSYKEVFMQLRKAYSKVIELSDAYEAYKKKMNIQ